MDVTACHVKKAKQRGKTSRKVSDSQNKERVVKVEGVGTNTGGRKRKKNIKKKIDVSRLRKERKYK